MDGFKHSRDLNHDYSGARCRKKPFIHAMFVFLYAYVLTPEAYASGKMKLFRGGHEPNDNEPVDIDVLSISNGFEERSQIELGKSLREVGLAESDSLDTCPKTPSTWCTHDGTSIKYRKCGGSDGWWCVDTNGNTGFLPCKGHPTPANSAWPHGKCERKCNKIADNFEERSQIVLGTSFTGESLAEDDIKVSSTKCNKDADCPLSLPHCLLDENQHVRPVLNHCYECLNNNHCPSSKPQCHVDYSNAYCDSVDVKEVPSIDKAEVGYNVYLGDPLNVLNGGRVHDPGYRTRKLFNQQWDTSTKFKVSVHEDTDYYRPVGYAITTAGVFCTKKSETSTLTSSTKLDTAISESIKYGGEAQDKGITYAATSGSSSYSEVRKRVMSSKTTIATRATCALYKFEVKSKNTIIDNLTDDAKVTISKLGKNNSLWGSFFNNYGTHVITGGIMGAFHKVSVEFNKREVEKLTKSGKSFEKSVSIGMEDIFGLSVEKSGKSSNEFGRAIQEMHKNLVGVSKGNVENLLDRPGFIQSTLEPICEYIGYNKALQNTCYEKLNSYCVWWLSHQGFIDDQGKALSSCMIPDSYKFDCFDDSNCGPYKECCSGTCTVTRECSNDSMCAHKKYHACIDGSCKKVLKAASYDTRTTHCSPAPRCYSSENKYKWHNGFACKWITCRKIKCPAGYTICENISAVECSGRSGSNECRCVPLNYSYLCP